MTSATVPGRRMSLWRLEWLRLVRTPRAVSLGAVFLATGLIEPVATRYASALLSHVASGTVVNLPKPTAAQALSSYVSEATIIGLIVLVATAASAYNFDARPGLSVFFRTRVPSMWPYWLRRGSPPARRRAWSRTCSARSPRGMRRVCSSAPCLPGASWPGCCARRST